MADLDLDAIGTVAIVWRANGADGTADAIEALVAEVRRLRAIEDAARAFVEYGNEAVVADHQRLREALEGRRG